MSELNTGDKINKPHRCTHEGCNYSFSRPYRLVQHLLVHNNLKIYDCPKENCKKSYTSKSHLDRHVNSVHNETEKRREILYSCPTCMKQYANRQNLKRHIKIHHNLKVPLSCDTCKLEFRKKHQLSAHMYQHTGIKAFSCEICFIEFASLREKKSHSRVHKIYDCKMCPQKFNQWSKYQKHMKTDHVTNEYTCDDCGRVFKQRNHILRHIKTHYITRTFTCPYENCKRFYSRNSNLRQHILIKHEKITHGCDICEAQLSTKAKLEEHLTRIHGKEPKIRVPKTKCTGRRPRKDMGSLKISTALKIAGEPIDLSLKKREDPMEIERKREEAINSARYIDIIVV